MCFGSLKYHLLQAGDLEVKNSLIRQVKRMPVKQTFLLLIEIMDTENQGHLLKFSEVISGTVC